MNIVFKNVNDLKEYDNNPRINDDAIDKVAKSIEQFGFKVPVVVDKDNTIVCGHTRLKASKQLGLKEIPCIIADDLNKEQINAYRLIDNRTSDYSHWDFDKLELELKQLEDIKEFEMKEFGLITKEDAFFNRDTKQEKFEHQDNNDEYNDFIDKFKNNQNKMNTDDCYTPEKIYNAVVEFVESEYKVNRKDFVRPFYPGGDYENYNYKDSDIIVDNPPFSIYSKIVNFYVEKGIKFFLFAPGTLCLRPKNKKVTYIIIDKTITYENGAQVNTNFVTNLDKIQGIRSAVKLAKNIVDKTQVKLTNKYKYPDNILKTNDLCKLENDFIIKASEYDFIDFLCDKDGNKGSMFGNKIIVSNNVVKRYNKQKLKNNNIIQLVLSEQQQRILNELNKKEGD